MTKSEISSKVFAIYLFIAGIMLVFAPNILLSIFGMPPTSEVWIHAVGLTVFNIGIYAWVAAKHIPFLKASVYARFIVFVAFTFFAVRGIASPMIAIFGVTDLCGGLWTHFALKADANVAKSSIVI